MNDESLSASNGADGAVVVSDWFIIQHRGVVTIEQDDGPFQQLQLESVTVPMPIP